jgi:hypothetical protein
MMLMCARGTANLITQKYTLVLQKSQQAQQMMRQPPGGMGFMPPMGMELRAGNM